MNITFYGAAQTVTGSKHMVRLANGIQFLLDCGMYQGLGLNSQAMNQNFGFNPEDVDFLILSHAHIDHSGLIPKLVREGFNGKVYCTEATYDLCEIMLMDSAHIQVADIRFQKKIDEKTYDPLYDKEDVLKALKLFHPLPFDSEYKINDFVKLSFTNNGHILGSAAVSLKLLEGSSWKNLTFTGDIGRFNTLLLRDPEAFPQADAIICESTYGDRLHDSIDNAANDLLEAVLNCCKKKKGKLIIPAFSLGRTQELVYTLNKLNLFGLLPDIKVYVDSPLSTNATNITRKHVNLLNDEVKEFTEKQSDPFGFANLTYIKEKNESKALNQLKEPAIIISAAGMAEAGRIKHHLANEIENQANTILLVGYAEPLSLAGKLRAGDSQVKIFGTNYAVNAEVKIIDSFSAHGDYKEMIQYLSCQDPGLVEKLFLVHGNKKSQMFFKDELKKVGFNNIFIPALGDSFYIN